MEKILLAVGFIEMEKYIQQELKDEFQFVGVATDKEGILPLVEQRRPSILVVRETLIGQENIYAIVHTLRSSYPDIRIVFLAKNRHPGDKFLSLLVTYGVYDIVCGSSIDLTSVIDRIRSPHEYKHVSHYIVVEPMVDDFGNEVPVTAYVRKGSERGEEREEEGTHSTGMASLTSVFKLKSTDSSAKDTPLEELSPKPQEQKPMKPTAIEPKEIPSKNAPVTKSHKTHSKIFSFVGAKGGVGTTTIAMNVAAYLADRGYRTLLIEFAFDAPTIKYLFDIYLNHGLDTALRGAMNRDIAEIQNSIVHLKQYRGLEHIAGKLPVLFDIMGYGLQATQEMQEHSIQELLALLVDPLQYEYIVLDLSQVPKNHVYEQALTRSNHIFYITTQDIVHLAYLRREVESLKMKHAAILSKCHVIVNKMEEGSISKESLEELVGQSYLPFHPYHKEIIQHNMEAIPLVLAEKKKFRSFKTLEYIKNLE